MHKAVSAHLETFSTSGKYAANSKTDNTLTIPLPNNINTDCVFLHWYVSYQFYSDSSYTKRSNTGLLINNEKFVNLSIQGSASEITVSISDLSIPTTTTVMTNLSGSTSNNKMHINENNIILEPHYKSSSDWAYESYRFAYINIL